MEKSARFTFGHQLWDNMFWSIASGIPISTAWVVLYCYVAANGWVPTLESFSASPIWFIAMFFIIRFWQSFHFYWMKNYIFRWIYLALGRYPENNVSSN